MGVIDRRESPEPAVQTEPCKKRVPSFGCKALGGRGSSGPRDHGYLSVLWQINPPGHCFYKMQHVRVMGPRRLAPSFQDKNPLRLGRCIGREAFIIHRGSAL